MVSVSIRKTVILKQKSLSDLKLNMFIKVNKKGDFQNRPSYMCKIYY